MKKQPVKKLVLSRETLRGLEEPVLQGVEGGVTARTACGSCPPSACAITFCGC